ncbi:hypothetical protein OYC64_016061 [Pagothenia borchgrevinki]|uniref:HAT C-terminal dimerisation domain-containing protein n=1 Tax=Pagothenia borchgrevinki TaxID=8213 RepID=A0ABD2HHR1_PAGBO
MIPELVAMRLRHQHSHRVRQREPAGPSCSNDRRRHTGRVVKHPVWGGLLHSSPDHNEVELYFNEPCIPPQENPLQWWRKNEGRYRKLSVLAKEYLAIPATSVPAERVFSTAGLIVNRLRTRLSPEHVDMLIFLNKNE